MAGHGGVLTGLDWLLRLALQVPKKSGGPPVVGDAPIPGFRHFLGGDTLDPADRFTVNGELPTYEGASQDALQGLMGRLAHRMSVPCEIQDNPGIPSGYTYLMQLVAHDLVQSSVAVSMIGDASGGVRNNRKGRLRLDTIYGAGPDLNAFTYAMEDRDDTIRTRLRLGRMAQDPVAGCPFRDIARVSPLNQSGVEISGGLTDALIADSRNDDHAILSQLTTLFHLLHNGIAANLLPKPGPDADVGTVTTAAWRNFLCARAAVTLMYRNIIRKDVMQKVLHPTIYAAYRNIVDPGELVDPPDDRIPLEFSHAAYRFGHAMVRHTYKINAMQDEQRVAAAMLATSSRGPLRVPLGADWIVSWSRFFGINGSSPNSSQRIRPTYSPGLLDQDLFPEVGQTNQPGLAARDLYSSAELGLWSASRLIDRLRQIGGKLGGIIPTAIEASPMLRSKDWRTQKLTQWLSQHRESHALKDEDIATLAKEPPLLLFILFEAWADETPDGKSLAGAHLGVLGSLLVADVVFGALADRPPWEDLSLATGLKNLNDKFFDRGSNVFSSVPPLDSMGALVEYVAKLNDLGNAQPAFL